MPLKMECIYPKELSHSLKRYLHLHITKAFSHPFKLLEIFYFHEMNSTKQDYKNIFFYFFIFFFLLFSFFFFLLFIYLFFFCSEFCHTLK